MADREQTRRDAELERWINATRVLKQRAEQAERERDEARGIFPGPEKHIQVLATSLREAEARLAKVPALVEAVRHFTDGPGSMAELVDALTVWDAE